MQNIDSNSVKKDRVVIFTLIAFISGFLAGVIYSAAKAPTAPAQLGGAQYPATQPSQGIPQGEKIYSLLQRIEDNPQDIDALIELGDIYFDRNSHQEGIEIFTKAELIDPTNIHVLNDLGLLYMNIGNYDKAVEKFETVLNIDPSQNHSLYHVGLIYSEKGEREKALNAFENVLKLNPTPELAAQVEQAVAALKGELKPQ